MNKSGMDLGVETGGTDSLPGQDIHLSAASGLRIILIGESEAGKSAVGNAILGRGAFDSVGVKTRTAVRRQGMVAGRQVTVVDTPGWEWFPSSGSSLEVQKEIIRGVSLCQPGPHVILLVVPLSFSFTQREHQAAVDHMEMLGEQAWGHTLVLFTVKGGRLKDTTLEEEVEESEWLEGLVRRCRGRCHALHGRTRKGQDTVAELMKKMDDMMATNRGELLSSIAILEDAREKEKEEVRRHQEEAREREQVRRRVEVALREREVRKREESANESTRQQSRRTRYTNEIPDSVENRSTDHTSGSNSTWADLRTVVSRRCKTIIWGDKKGSKGQRNEH